MALSLPVRAAVRLGVGGRKEIAAGEVPDVAGDGHHGLDGGPAQCRGDPGVVRLRIARCSDHYLIHRGRGEQVDIQAKGFGLCEDDARNSLRVIARRGDRDGVGTADAQAPGVEDAIGAGSRDGTCAGGGMDNGHRRIRDRRPVIAAQLAADGAGGFLGEGRDGHGAHQGGDRRAVGEHSRGHHGYPSIGSIRPAACPDRSGVRIARNVTIWVTVF